MAIPEGYDKVAEAGSMVLAVGEVEVMGQPIEKWLVLNGSRVVATIEEHPHLVISDIVVATWQSFLGRKPERQ